MAIIDPRLNAADQTARVGVILHVDDPGGRRLALEASGLVVRQTFRLTRTVAGTCLARALPGLAALDWVRRIEPDGSLHVLEQSHGRHQ